MIDFEIMERSLKLAWIKRIAENNLAAWKIIPEQALSQYGGFAFFSLNASMILIFVTFKICLNFTEPFWVTGKILSS